MTSNIASSEIAQHALELRRLTKEASKHKLDETVKGMKNYFCFTNSL